jgi:hypothetical protein
MIDAFVNIAALLSVSSQALLWPRPAGVILRDIVLECTLGLGFGLFCKELMRTNCDIIWMWRLGSHQCGFGLDFVSIIYIHWKPARKV